MGLAPINIFFFQKIKNILQNMREILYFPLIQFYEGSVGYGGVGGGP